MYPERKVTVGAVAGALTVVGVFVVQQFGITVSAEVASAITVLVTFVLSYLVPNPKKES